MKSLTIGSSAGTADEGVEIKIEEGDPKCRKILPSVISAMRSSFRKCGIRRRVGPVHGGFLTLLVAVSETGDESTRDLEISMEDGDSNVVLLQIEEKNSK